MLLLCAPDAANDHCRGVAPSDLALSHDTFLNFWVTVPQCCRSIGVYFVFSQKPLDDTWIQWWCMSSPKIQWWCISSPNWLC